MYIIQKRAVIHIRLTDTTLACKGIDFSSRKQRIYGPRYLCVISQWYALGELRTYRAADNNKKGVVGRIGRNIPITPNTKDKLPIINKTYFIAQIYNEADT